MYIGIAFEDGFGEAFEDIFGGCVSGVFIGCLYRRLWPCDKFVDVSGVWSCRPDWPS